jgi:hypothetical protein
MGYKIFFESSGKGRKKLLQRGDRICQEKEHNRDNTLALNYVAVSGDFNLSRCSTDKALSG